MLLRLSFIFTYSKRSLNESLDFCNRSYPHELHKFDWQLSSSRACTIRFDIELISQKWPGVVIDIEPHPSRTCKTSLLYAPLAVRGSSWLFRFSILHSNKTVNTILFLKRNSFNSYIKNILYIFDIYILNCSWNHGYIGSLAKLTWSLSWIILIFWASRKLCKRPEVFMIPWTFQKLNSYLKSLTD